MYVVHVTVNKLFNVS